MGVAGEGPSSARTPAHGDGATVGWRPSATWPNVYRTPPLAPPAPCPLLQIRSMLKRQQQGKYVAKVQSRQERKLHVAANPLPENPLGGVFK